jgi:predicted nucleic-acid-binding protein
MVAFDTNYLVRHLVQDDARQCRIVAETLISETQAGNRIAIFDIVLCETVWVLDSVYGASRKDLATALRGLRKEPVFEFDNPVRIDAAIKRFETSKAEFSDCLIATISTEHRRRLLTFDKKLQRLLE